MLTAPSGSPGHGRIHLARSSPSVAASFTSLSFAYPLKILTPRSTNRSLGAAYLLSYGGGLVGGDNIALDVRVESGAELVCLTQGSTKVFKVRPGSPSAPSDRTTEQTMRVSIADEAALYLLPAPVTCFADASYSQIQDFNLEGPRASLIVLDWFTSGRMHLRAANESWMFRRYRSSNTVVVGDSRLQSSERLLMRDVQLLENSQAASLPQSAFPYAVYMTLLICPPRAPHDEPSSPRHATARLFDVLKARTSQESQRRSPNPSALIWSWSEIERAGRVAGVVRAAAYETDLLRAWIEGIMLEGGLRDTLGADLFRNAFRA